MNQLWHRVTGPSCFSWLAAAYTFAVMLPTTVFGAQVPLGYWPQLVGMAIIAIVPMVAWMFLARWFLFRRSTEPRPLGVLLAVLLAVLIRASLLDWLLLAAGLSQQSVLGYRIVSSTVPIGIGWLVIAYAVSVAGDITRDLDRIQHESVALDELRSSQEQLLRQRREHAVEHVRLQLEQQLEAMLADEPAQALGRMREIIEQIVRPVSQRLAREVEALADTVAPPVPSRVDWRQVARRVLAENPIRPLWFALWVGVTAFLVLSFWGGPGFGAAIGAIYLVSTLLVASLGSVTWRWARHLPLPWRALWYTLVLALCALFGNDMAVRLMPDAVATRPLLIPLLVLGLLNGWLVAGVSALGAELRALHRQVAELSAELNAERVRVQTLVWQQQRALSRVLHGSIQDALSASSFRLAEAVRAGSASPELVAELQAALTNRLRELARSEAPSGSVEQVLADIAELWEGVARVDWELSADAAALLAAAPATTESAMEIVREACSNAVRHGQAALIRVRVSAEHQRLQIEVANDGQLRASAGPTGLGTELLDELTLNWSLSTADSWVWLRATLPSV